MILVATFEFVSGPICDNGFVVVVFFLQVGAEEVVLLAVGHLSYSAAAAKKGEKAQPRPWIRALDTLLLLLLRRSGGYNRKAIHYRLLWPSYFYAGKRTKALRENA